MKWVCVHGIVTSCVSCSLEYLKLQLYLKIRFLFLMSFGGHCIELIYSYIDLK